MNDVEVLIDALVKSKKAWEEASMRDFDEVKERLEEVERGLAFWKAEAEKNYPEVPYGYAGYAAGVVGQLQHEQTLLRWVLGEDVELPPAG